MSDKNQEGVVSVSNRIWVKNKINESFVEEIKRVVEVNDLVAQLLSTRVNSVEEAYHFLNPRVKDLLPDPYHLLDMDKAVSRILRALRNDETIYILADYDVDGATSSALLRKLFMCLKIKCNVYIPDRILEGYGPNINAINKIVESGASVLITVDCGSVSFNELDHAKRVGLDTIVIDHHVGIDALPEAVAVVNPNRLDETSKCVDLAAVGVSFLFAVAIIIAVRNDDELMTKYKKLPNLMEYLDLVALGTVCDVMKMTALNRAFIKQGLTQISRRTNKGIAALCDTSKINTKITEYHIGYVIGPKINAGGRVGSSSSGASLLCTDDDRLIKTLVDSLNACNETRKQVEEDTLKIAQVMAHEQSNNASIFLHGLKWHPGVIGIIASKIKDKYSKPVSVVSIDNHGIGKGSCRSIKGVDFAARIVDAKNNGLILSGGGHKMAAGFSVLKDKIEDLKKFFEEKFAEDIAKLTDVTTEFYDIDITSDALKLDIVDDIEKLAPFGGGNSKPIVRISDLYVLKASVIKEKHIKVILSPSNSFLQRSSIHAISFNSFGTNISDALLSDKKNKISVLGNLQINSFNDRETVQLIIIDVIV